MRTGSHGGPGFWYVSAYIYSTIECNSLISLFRHNLPVNVCSNEIITFPASPFDPLASAAKNITNTERTYSGQIVLDEVETLANITLLYCRCYTIILNGRVPLNT